MWTGNEMLDKLRSRAAASPSGTITVSIEELNAVCPPAIREAAEAVRLAWGEYDNQVYVHYVLKRSPVSWLVEDQRKLVDAIHNLMRLVQGGDMKEPEKSWLESGKALLKSEDYRKAVREMGRSKMGDAHSDIDGSAYHRYALGRLDSVLEHIKQYKTDFPEYAEAIQARLPISPDIREAAERVEQAIGLDSLLVVYFPWVGEAIRSLMRLVRGEQPKEGEEPA